MRLATSENRVGKVWFLSLSYLQYRKFCKEKEKCSMDD